MKLCFARLLLASSLAISFASSANTDQLQEITKECQEWAIEDQIANDRLDEYLQSCIQESLAAYEQAISTTAVEALEDDLSTLDESEQDDFPEAIPEVFDEANPTVSEETAP